MHSIFFIMVLFRSPVSLTELTLHSFCVSIMLLQRPACSGSRALAETVTGRQADCLLGRKRQDPELCPRSLWWGSPQSPPPGVGWGLPLPGGRSVAWHGSTAQRRRALSRFPVPVRFCFTSTPTLFLAPPPSKGAPITGAMCCPQENGPSLERAVN